MITKPEHPGKYLDNSIIELLADYGRKAELIRTLHPEQLKMIYARKWMKLYVPKRKGGLGLSLPEILKIEEGLAYADGSTAWVVTLCSGAAWFYGFIDPQVADEIFEDEQLCLAGSGAAAGTATVTNKGYLVNGAWKYASGAKHATAFTANCIVKKGDKQMLNADGSPMVLSFIFKRDEVKINRTWNAMGMIATGSYSFDVNQVEVSANRAFRINADHATHPDPIFKFPFTQLAETTLAVNLSGMAVKFLDLCQVMLEQRDKSSEVSQWCRKSQLAFHKMRSNFHAAALLSWNELITNNKIDEVLLNRLSQLSTELSQESRRLVNEFYPHCGLVAADMRTEINRTWRNLNTAGQHALFNSRKTLSLKSFADA